MDKLYPQLEPYDFGLLDVGHKHKIYWEKLGKENGIPVLVLHGGPGAGGNKSLRQFFDPNYYNIIIFDQRGCGRSIPSGSIENNTTQHLIEDIEKLRTFLKIKKWIIFGGSWGSSLALVYSQKHPEKILNIILRGIFLCRKHEIDWFLYGMKNIFPDYWKRFANFLPKNERTDLLKSYYKRLTSKDLSTCVEAGLSWAKYEANCSTYLPNGSVTEEFLDTEMAINLARIEAHYFINNLFLNENQLLNNIKKIDNIKGYIIQGRYDVICPPQSAYELSKAWTKSEIKIVEKAGHSSLEPKIKNAILQTMENIKKKDEFNEHREF
tara:strand:- start:11101 stop:12069 length:969 start_codon:yes stop_codon:yes gene_type:complete